MPYRWDSGWSGAVLLVCFVLFPSLALVVRRKWRLAEARRVEVMRLVRLAAAEAERAEKEAAAAFAFTTEPPFTAVFGGGIVMSNCAVCNSPTATRCARCKVVKYCSGKCQIIHWRKGHKDVCHPPPVEHFKSQPYVPVLRGGLVERSEVSDNGLANEGHRDTNGDQRNTHQSVCVMEGGYDEETGFGDSRAEIKGKLDGVNFFETLSKVTSIKHDQSGKGRFSASLIGSLPSNCSTLSDPAEKSGDTAFKESLTRGEPGQHANANPSYVSLDGLEKSFFSGSMESSRSLIVGTGAGNAFDNASSGDLKQQPMCIDEKTDPKLDVLSNISFSNSRLVDAQLYQNATESRYVGLSSKICKKFEISNALQSENKCLEEILDSTASKTVRSGDCAESQTSGNSYHPQLDAKLHPEVAANLSTAKCFSSAPTPVRLEPKDTKSLDIESSSRAANVNKNNELLKSLSPSSVEDHLSSLAQGLTILRNESQRVEKVPAVPANSVKISVSLLNGKVHAQEGVKQIISSASIKHDQSGICSYGSGRYNYRMLFPYELFIKLYNSDKVELNPCGLINCGNSCFANAALQCLAFTRPLAAYLLEGLHAKSCLKKEWCFTCAFESLLMKAKQGKSPLSPSGIISHIRDIGSNFSQGREEDAHEFLRHAIDAMQSACLKEAAASADSELAQETTLIQLIFGGYLHSKIKCMRCKGKSERRERMMDLTVEMHGDIETLEEALARFTATEILEGENKYKCDRCKSYEQAKKQLTILEAPNVLTIALKRYQSGKFGKLNKMVRFPEYLNLAPYMSGPDDKSPVYRLYAVVVHHDVMNAAFSGHYVCYVKNTLGKWFKADDSVVKQVDLQTVLSQGAYMLLYARCSPRAPSLLRKEIAKKSKLKQSGDANDSKTRSSSMFSRTGLTVIHRDKKCASQACGSTNFGLHDLFDERLRRSKLDISSGNSSLFSFSDEGSSWSADSTKDSSTTEDFSESICREPGHISCNSPLRFSEDSDGFSYSPSQMSDSPDISPMGSRLNKDDGRGFKGENLPFLYSTKQYRNLTEQ